MNSVESTENKTVIVGFDGLDWRYLDRFSDDLEHFTELQYRGVSTDLVSTHPPWTGSAWPSMYTGVPPDHHGVFDFFDYENRYPDTAIVVSRADVKAPALWEYLTEREIASFVLNLPVTHPVDSTTGVIVPGYIAPEDEPGHPEGIRQEISDGIGQPYTIYSEHETSSDLNRKVEGYVDVIDLRGAAAEYLIKSTDWQIGIVQFQKTDAVFHNSNNSDHFREVYVAADRALGRILDACPDGVNVIICSDHGIGPVDGYQIHVNQILEDHGYLTSSDTVDETWGSFKPTSDDGGENADGGNRIIDRVVAIADALQISPAAAHSIADRLGIAETLLQMMSSDVRDTLANGVSWEASQAFCRRQTEQGIRINLKGRDPAGVVEEHEYETVRTEIIDILSNLRTPDGKPAFEFVCRREEVYDGPYAEHACDILFLPNEMNHVISPKLFGGRFHPVDGHDHKKNGVFIAAGPDINESGVLDELSLIDIAPLALTLLDQPVPEQMVGAVPESLVPSRTVTRRQYDASVDHSSYEQDQDEAKARLSDLGYL